MAKILLCEDELRKRNLLELLVNITFPLVKPDNKKPQTALIAHCDQYGRVSGHKVSLQSGLTV